MSVAPNDYVPDWIIVVAVIAVIAAALGVFGSGCFKVESGAFTDAVQITVSVESNVVDVAVTD